MTNSEILHADLLDILFENRNKAYGAYALRKNYNHRLALAMGISFITIIMLMTVKFSRTEIDHNNFPESKIVKLTTVNLPAPKPPEPDQPKPRTKPPKAEVIYGSQIKIVDDSHKTVMPEMNEIDTSLISLRTVKGEALNDTVENNTSTGNNNESKADKGRESNVALTSSDAQFPGGKNAFEKFLSRNLITPGELIVGEKKTVLVRFMVGIDGNISKTEVLQTDGEQYSREVLRVLNKMPKWIPAMQNGTKVAAWFSQLVTFIGVEQ